jgi:hypothetical protein
MISSFHFSLAFGRALHFGEPCNSSLCLSALILLVQPHMAQVSKSLWHQWALTYKWWEGGTSAQQFPCVQRCHIPVQVPGMWQLHSGQKHMLSALFYKKIKKYKFSKNTVSFSLQPDLIIASRYSWPIIVISLPTWPVSKRHPSHLFSLFFFKSSWSFSHQLLFTSPSQLFK